MVVCGGLIGLVLHVSLAPRWQVAELIGDAGVVHGYRYAGNDERVT